MVCQIYRVLLNVQGFVVETFRGEGKLSTWILDCAEIMAHESNQISHVHQFRKTH